MPQDPGPRPQKLRGPQTSRRPSLAPGHRRRRRSPAETGQPRDPPPHAKAFPSRANPTSAARSPAARRACPAALPSSLRPGRGRPRGASGGLGRGASRAGAPTPCATHLRAAAPAWHSAARRPPHLGGAGPPRAPRPRRGLQLASPAREGAAAGGRRAAGRAGRGGPGRAGCLFVCSPRSLAEPSDHMPRGENMGFAQWRQDSGLTLTAGSIY